MLVGGALLQGGFGSDAQDVVFVIKGVIAVVGYVGHSAGAVVGVCVADVLVGCNNGVRLDFRIFFLARTVSLQLD